uniref:Uncharacterized protein n=1 Tax=Magallana gigas TaxID=29159 RepID=K1R125_MAGGI
MTRASTHKKDNPGTVQVVLPGCGSSPGRAALLRLIHEACPAQSRWRRQHLPCVCHPSLDTGTEMRQVWCCS